ISREEYKPVNRSVSIRPIDVVGKPPLCDDLAGAVRDPEDRGCVLESYAFAFRIEPESVAAGMKRLAIGWPRTLLQRELCLTQNAPAALVGLELRTTRSSSRRREVVALCRRRRWRGALRLN